VRVDEKERVRAVMVGERLLPVLRDDPDALQPLVEFLELVDVVGLPPSSEPI
jgi:hypothetical protein